MTYEPLVQGDDEIRADRYKLIAKACVIVAWGCALGACGVGVLGGWASQMPTISLCIGLSMLLSLVSILFWWLYVRATDEEDDRIIASAMIYAILTVVTFVASLIASIAILELRS